MIRLGASGESRGIRTRLIGRVTREPLPGSARRDAVLATETLPSSTELDGYDAALCSHAVHDDQSIPTVALLPLDHLSSGDVVSIDPSGYVRTLYRKQSDHNAIFFTDQCNSFCLMCSQPPKRVDESGRVAELLRLVGLIDPATRYLGMTGGEPTLFRDEFLDVIRACRMELPTTSLHILTNGRLFYYGAFASALGAIGHPSLMLGIPVYSDLEYEHDHVVQSRNAFNETLIGLQNLARSGVSVEIRIVVHRLTARRLPNLAEFIYRNLTFADHVAFMGLEAMGFAVANRSTLWIDPWDYQETLREAVFVLADRGMNVSIYNHQLCTLPRDVWPFARKSISDWKNEYLPVCDGCSVRSDCGGLFASSVQRKLMSSHIRAIA